MSPKAQVFTSKQPLVTVVITNYNYGNYLERAVRSAQWQDYGNLEIIIADDASTDDSLFIAERLVAEDGRVRLISRQSNLGLARNKQGACSEANGEFLTFLDADDYLCSKEKISSEVALIIEHEKSTGTTCVAYSGRQTIVAGKVKPPKATLTELARGDIFLQLITRELREIPRDFTVRTESFWKSGGFDEESILYVDWILKIRLASRLKFFPTNTVGIAYVKHDGAMSSVPWNFHRKAIMRAYRTHRDLISSRWTRWGADFLMWKKFGIAHSVYHALRRLPGPRVSTTSRQAAAQD